MISTSSHPKSQIVTTIPWSSAFAPGDKSRLLREISLPTAISGTAIDNVISNQLELLDAEYRSLGGSGLGCDQFQIFPSDESPLNARISLFPRKAGEEKLMRRLSKLIELDQMPEIDEETLPIENHPDDFVSDEEFDHLLLHGSKDLSQVFAMIDAMKRK